MSSTHYICVYVHVHFLALFLAVPLINGVPSFAINASTGEITVNSASLDREHIPNYAIVVKVCVCVCVCVCV